MTLKFAVYGVVQSDDVREIIDSLDQHPKVERIMYHTKLADELEREGYTLEEIKSADLDFVMTIGGDGTILHLMQRANPRVLGINTGRVGFLTAVELSEVDKALELVDNDEYFIDERIKLKTILNGEDKGNSTNEVVVHTDRVAKIRSFEVYHDGSLVDRFRADGLIISTPTGSTCYSMSAGGPIVDPKVDAFIIVPIAPYKLATKPYIVPEDEEIRVKLLEKDKSCLMVLDGQKEFSVDDEDELIFKLGDEKAKFISLEDDFYQRIRKKLVWK